MKRDMDMVRELLLLTEGFDGAHYEIQQLQTNLDKNALAYNALLMREAGLIEGEPLVGSQGQLVDFAVMRLTWSGHDFLDAIRDDGLWKKAKDTVMKPAASFTFEILKGWLKEQIRAHLPTI